MTRAYRCIKCIVPPHLLKRLCIAEPQRFTSGLNTLLYSATSRERSIRATFAAAPANSRRAILTAGVTRSLLAQAGPGRRRRRRIPDDSKSRIRRGRETRDFYKKVFNQTSIDDRACVSTG